MQLYQGDRTLYHLDDGSDIYFVVDAATYRDLLALGVERWMLRPEWPGDSLERITDPRWQGG